MNTLGIVLCAKSVQAEKTRASSLAKTDNTLDC